MRVRNINYFGPEHTDQTQNLLSPRARASSNSDQCHLSLDMRTSGYILNLTNSCQSLALFDYLLDRAVFTACNDGHSRPVRVQGLATRDRFYVESTRTKQPDDAGYLARLVGNDDG